jgi:RNA polymerase sigma factor (TIGR02999 family)
MAAQTGSSGADEPDFPPAAHSSLTVRGAADEDTAALTPDPLDTQPSDITRLLLEASHGRVDAMEALLPLVYGELKRLADAQMRQERPDHTLGTTGLVHEAYLRLVDSASIDWQGRAHFFGVASRAMRRILVDHARRRTAQKRSRQQGVSLDEAMAGAVDLPGDEVLAVDDALERFARQDPRAAQLVELRYFAGFSIEEAAELLSISPATAKRDWALARAWLARDLA